MDLKTNKFEFNNVIVEYDDFIAYVKFTPANTFLKIWKAIGLGYIVIATLTFCITLLLGGNSPEASNTDLLSFDFISRIFGFSMMTFILFILPWFVYPKISSKMFKKAYNNNKRISVPQNFYFDDVGFKATTINHESRYLWEDVNVVKETKYFLAIYISSHQAVSIPARYLNHKQDFLNFIKIKTGDKYTVVGQGLQSIKD